MAQKLILPINKTRITAGYKNANYKNQFGFNHYGSDSTSTNSNRTVWGSGVGKILEKGLERSYSTTLSFRAYRRIKRAIYYKGYSCWIVWKYREVCNRSTPSCRIRYRC